MAYKDKAKRKEYMRIYRKQYRKNNPEQRKAETKRLYDKRKRYIDDYKLSKGCQFCGYSDYADALCFHHINDNKNFTVATAKTKGWKRLKEEIKKCIVLCNNCHIELHRGVNKINTSYFQIIREIDYKKVVLDFDYWLYKQKIHINLEDIKEKWEKIKGEA